MVKVISPKTVQSPFSIPNCPEYLSKERICQITNIHILKKYEGEYDYFLETKCQILLLLRVIDEVFEIRDELVLRLNTLERENLRKSRALHVADATGFE